MTSSRPDPALTRTADEPDAVHRARDAVDLRMIGPALGAWAGAVVSTRLPVLAAAAVTLGLVAVLVLVARFAPAARARPAWTALVIVLLLAAVAAGIIRATTMRTGIVADHATERAAVRAVADVTSDPRVFDGMFGSTTVFKATVRAIEVRGERYVLRTPVRIRDSGGDSSDGESSAAGPAVRLGERITIVGRLAPADRGDVAAVVSVTSVAALPDGDPAWWWDGAQGLRAAVSESVAGRGQHVSALVPALVHGDDQALADDLREAFVTSGLTHLLAVSGTNLTLLVGFLLALARPLGAGPRVRVVLAVLATIGYVLLARPEPSVVRAAVMGLVGVAGLSTGGRARGARCLAWAVVAVVLIDPWLATSAGFLLSALATGGILLLAPVWRDALARWMPAWLAEAIAVPAAAQLACTAPVAALSGEVSLVAIAANLVAAPAVGPATVLGLGGGLVGLLWAPLGAIVGYVTALPAGWIVIVGLRSSAVPGAAASVGDGPAAVAVLAVASAAIAVTGHRVLRRPLVTLLLTAVSAVLALAPLSPGWPPSDWVMVACDVGQGDATVLRAGPRAAVVIDAGPDARLVDRCLRSLGIDQVPALILTHAHADHVDGVAGVLRGRDVDWIGVGPSRPAALSRPVRVLVPGDRWQIGEVTLTVLGPVGQFAGGSVETTGRTDEGTDGANDASVVVLAEVSGARILLTGDVEPPAQGAIERAYPSLQVDVLKVPHHGSRHQDADWLAGLGARWATVSAGEGNTYGHPAPETLEVLRDAGVTVLRTDPGHDVAIVVRGGELGGVAR